MQDVQATLPVGTVIRDRYIIKSLIGTGRSGAVYLVEDQRAKRTPQQLFALKEVIGLTRQERYQLSFERTVLTRLQHKALSHVYHIFNDDKRERVYLLMQYIEGPDLETLWQQQPEQRFSWPEVRAMMAPIIDAVSYLHQQQPPVFHRDIKPINIIVPTAGKRVVLVDVGIAKDDHASRGQPSSESGMHLDICELAATCYALLTGEEPPNVRSRLAQVGQKQEDPLEMAHMLIPTIPAHVATAMHQAMSLHPSARFSSVKQFWNALNTAPTEQYIASRSPGPTSTSSPASASHTHAQTPKRATVSSVQQRGALQSPNRLSGKFVILLVLVLLVGVSAVASLWSSLGNPSPTSNGTHRMLSTPTLPSLPTFTPSTPPSRPSTPLNGPLLAGTYTGTLFDIAANRTASITFTALPQNQGAIHGYFTVMSNAQESGPFSGTITQLRQVQFMVTNAAGDAVLFFEGSMQSATHLSGDYYRCRQISGGRCNRMPSDYGIWSAVLMPRNTYH